MATHIPYFSFVLAPQSRQIRWHYLSSKKASTRCFSHQHFLFANLGLLPSLQQRFELVDFLPSTRAHGTARHCRLPATAFGIPFSYGRRASCYTASAFDLVDYQSTPSAWWERWVSSPLRPKTTGLQPAAFADSLLSQIIRFIINPPSNPRLRQARRKKPNNKSYEMTTKAFSRSSRVILWSGWVTCLSSYHRWNLLNCTREWHGIIESNNYLKIRSFLFYPLN